MPPLHACKTVAWLGDGEEELGPHEELPKPITLPKPSLLGHEEVGVTIKGGLYI